MKFPGMGCLVEEGKFHRSGCLVRKEGIKRAGRPLPGRMEEGRWKNVSGLKKKKGLPG
jgi:hypothetical protein